MITEPHVQSEEEQARSALAFYEEQLKPVLEPERNGEYVAVHPPDGDYEVAATIPEVDTLLRARHPDALFVVMQIGYPVMRWPGDRVRHVFPTGICASDVDVPVQWRPAEGGIHR